MTIRKLNKNQFAFDMRHMGRRYRKVLSCSSSLVNEVYRKWQNEVVMNHGVEKHTLFKLFDVYLKWSKENKEENMHRKEVIYVTFLKQQFNKETLLNDVKRHHVENVISQLKQKGVKASTINRYTSTFSYFFNWCIKREYTTYNPAIKCRLKEQNERVISLTQREISEILEKAEGHLKDAIVIALNTGMRRGEILTLKWTQVNFETRFISLEATQTKGKTRRDIPMTDTLYDYLLKLRRGKIKQDTVIQYKGNKVNELKKSWNTLRKKLSFEIKINGLPLRFHDLRHCYATYLRMSGANLSDIQYLLRHKDMKTTQRYAHLTPTTIETVNNISKIIKIG